MNDMTRYRVNFCFGTTIRYDYGCDQQPDVKVSIPVFVGCSKLTFFL